MANDLMAVNSLKGTQTNLVSPSHVYAGKGPREKLDIHVADYFDEDCKRKNLHFFTYDSENNIGKLMYHDLTSKKQSQFQEINLDIDFVLPSFYKSVSLPDGEIYFIGGTKPGADKIKSNAIYRYDPSTHKLVKEGEGMKEARSSFGVCVLRNCIYVMGGIGNKNQYLNTCEKFNLRSKKWESVSQLNLPSASFCCTSFNNRFIFKIGGTNQDKSLVKTIEKYDVMQNKWHVINPQTENRGPSPQFLQHASCVQINSNEIFVYGGYDDEENSSNLSYVLSIEEIKDQSSQGAITKEENFVYLIQKVNAQPLPISLGFMNPQSIILDNTIHVLQDAQSNNPNENVDNKRTILQFNGKQWNIIRN